MKKAALTCLTATALIALSGCQTLESIKVDTSQKNFNAPSYYGKELTPQHLTIGPAADSGHRFRGFDIGRRHWGF